jgi:hypothetical protein
VKHLLQLIEEDEDGVSKSSYSRVKITKGIQVQLQAKLRELFLKDASLNRGDSDNNNTSP